MNWFDVIDKIWRAIFYVSLTICWIFAMHYTKSFFVMTVLMYISLDITKD
jgi:hypothetical protein